MFVAHPACYLLVPGSFLEVKRLEREVNHSPTPSAAVKNERSCSRVPPLRLRSVEADNFRFKRTDTTLLTI